jgi:hypothetical protein
LILQNGLSRYYHCAQLVMWRVHPIVVMAAATDGGGDALAARLMLSVASVLLVTDLVGRVRRHPSDQAGRRPGLEADVPS